MTSLTHAGVLEAATDISGVVRHAFSAQAAVFVVQQRLALVGTADAAGRLWASALAGEPGAFRVLDAHTLEIGAAHWRCTR